MASPMEELDPATQQALQEWEQRYEQVHRDHVQALAARGDSRSLLAAAELTSGSPLAIAPVDVRQRDASDDQALALFRAALATEPVDPLALWLGVSRCHGPRAESDCDRRALLQRLVEHDADNALVWLYLAVDARQAGDESQASQYFARAAAAPRFDSYDVAYGRFLLDAHEGLEVPPLAPELISALLLQATDGQVDDDELPFDLPELLDVAMMGRWAAFAFPAFNYLTDFCPVKEPATMEPSRGDECRALLATMSDTATTLLVKQIGLSYMTQLTRDDVDGAQWLERLRQSNWRQARYIELAQANHGMGPAVGYTRRLLAEGELVAMEHAIQSAGMALEAPRGWIPEHGIGRELLLAQRETAAD